MADPLLSEASEAMAIPHAPEAPYVTAHHRVAAVPLAQVTSDCYCEDTVVISVMGEIDLLTVPLLATEIAMAFAERIVTLVIDLSRVTFFGVAGAHVLATAASQAGAAGAQLVVVNAGAAAARVLQVTGLGDLLSFETLAQVLRAGSPSARPAAGQQEVPVPVPQPRFGAA